jgi:ribosomal protein L11 methyltransferase
VTGLFSGDTDPDMLRGALNRALACDIGRHLQLERVEDQDWERSWLSRFRPMRFGRRLWICPSGYRVDQADAVVVDLDPGLAFGSGTHPTTALCLQWLDGAELAGKTVIDFGCGSGILGIAALKLGAARVIAVDHDPQAILASRDNAIRNRVDERFEVYLDSDFPAQPVELVLANILANVLIELQPQIERLVAPGGELVLSGILADQASAVASAYATTLQVDPPQLFDDWVLLHAQRNE